MKLRRNEIVTPEGIVDGLVEVEAGKIVRIQQAAALEDEAWDEDWQGYKPLPGLIDIHTHGYYGYSALSVKPNDFRELSKQMAAIGVTGYLVTAGDHNATEMENSQRSRRRSRTRKSDRTRSADAGHSHGRSVPESRSARCFPARGAASAFD